MTTTEVKNKRQKYVGVKDLHMWTLIASNIFFFVWVIVEKWSFSQIIWVYWFQSVGLGIISFLKLGMTENVYVVKDLGLPFDPEIREGRGLNAIFFLLVYGLFHIFYMTIFLVEYEKVNFWSILLISLIFFAEQLFSFIYKKEWISTEPVNYEKLLDEPCLRILPMHGIIIGSKALEDIFDVNFEHITVLILFLILKIAADVGMYINIHNRPTYKFKGEEQIEERIIREKERRKEGS